MIQNIPLPGRLSLDIGGVVVAVATFFGYIAPMLGALASIAALVWYGVQLYYFFKDRK